MWKTVKLGELCTKITDGSHNPPKGIETSSHLMISSKNVLDDEINFEKPRYLSEDDFAQENKRTDVQQGDVLLTIVGTIGRCAVVGDLTQPFTLQRSVAVLKPKRETIDSRFLMYTLRGMLNELISGARGVAQKGIYLKSLKRLAIPLPPLAEQQRIVAKLDAAFAEIDRAVEIEGAKLSSVGALIAAKLESMYNDKRFEQKQLKDICKFVGGSQPPKSTFEYEQSDSNIRLIQIRDYKSDKHLTYIPKDKAKRWCSASDVMIGRYGPPIFQILRGIEGAYNVALMKAVPTAEMDNDYLFYFLSNRRIQSYVINKSSRAAGQSGVNKDALEPYPIYIPPLEEQHSIVQRTRSLIAQTDILEKSCRDKLKAMLSLKSSILSQELQPPQSEAA